MHARRCTPLLAVALAGIVALTACGGGGDSTPTSPGATTGSLAITATGLPSDRPAAVQVTGPAGYTHAITATATLSGLTPGAYTVTAARVHDVGLDYESAEAPATVTVTAGGQAAATVTYRLRTLARTTSNRTDETTSAKYHVMYVLPSDGADRALDTDGTIARTVSSWERWYAAQTGGRYLRLDTSDGALDITFVRLTRTDAAMTSYGDFIRDSLEKQLAQGGYTGVANTLYLVYYDGGHQTRCGSSAMPPGLPGVVAALFLKGLATSSVPCASNPFAATPSAAPSYIEFVAAHEALHLLGIVSPSAPAYVNGHVGTDPTDLMYAGTQVWRPSVLDVSKTNYYNAAGLPAGVVNLAQSPYLVQP